MLIILIICIILFLLFELFVCRDIKNTFIEHPDINIEHLDNITKKEEKPIVISEVEKNNIQNIMNELKHPQREFTTVTTGDDQIAERNLIMGSRARDAIFANARKSTQTNEHIIRPELDYLENVDWWARETEYDFDDYK